MQDRCDLISIVKRCRPAPNEGQPPWPRRPPRSTIRGVITDDLPPARTRHDLALPPATLATALVLASLFPAWAVLRGRYLSFHIEPTYGSSLKRSPTRARDTTSTPTRWGSMGYMDVPRDFIEAKVLGGAHLTPAGFPRNPTPGSP